ncbi:hypothetical protein [Halobacterium sp. R2-5]|uniref:DUF7310 family coiled-coil domain-containing protein n=1 Tax=Halobacterium sp. R2-5 TaxID=2715751 RepID=UPI00141FA326|nr:hypothetical protein [Halobacterium sp. R2-5]NIB98653.1 hypothetical protein [Halobacterium sp. R2-5]
MSDDDLAERLRAVERAVTDSDTAVSDLSGPAAVHERLDSLEAELDDLGERVDALDATVQSLHGYVGELEAVNERVQRRADAAREAVDRLEAEQSRPAANVPERATGNAGSADADSDSPERHDRTAGDSDLRSRTTDDESLLDRVRESL